MRAREHAGAERWDGAREGPVVPRLHYRQMNNKQNKTNKTNKNEIDLKNLSN